MGGAVHATLLPHCSGRCFWTGAFHSRASPRPCRAHCADACRLTTGSSAAAPDTIRLGVAAASRATARPATVTPMLRRRQGMRVGTIRHVRRHLRLPDCRWKHHRAGADSTQPPLWHQRLSRTIGLSPCPACDVFCIVIAGTRASAPAWQWQVCAARIEPLPSAGGQWLTG